MHAADRASLAELRIRTRRLTLAVCDDRTEAALRRAAADGAYPPGSPDAFAWHSDDPDERATRTIAWHRQCIDDWDPQRWRLELIARHDGTVVGTQSIHAERFDETRTVTSGSWLTLDAQGHGLGTEMRAAVLALAAAIGARTATSEALIENTASNAVSAKLGYQRCGIALRCAGGTARVVQLWRIELDALRPPVDVTITGLDGSRHLFGAQGTAAHP